MNNYQFTKIRQTFNNQAITDIEGATISAVTAKLNILAGANIAITVGSRGINNIARIAKAVVEAVRAKGGNPFIIPAMGSHGGATAEGQREILASYNVTEEAMGCPIRSSMEVVKIESNLEMSVYMDKYAYESDGVILLNRIKPHTAFHGEFESGLVKMSVIGLGKERLANEIHTYGIYGLKTLLPQAGRVVIGSGKIILGVGIVENAYDETAMIEALTPPEIITREPELLAIAKDLMPSFPLNEIDVLIIDQIGKNISGSGMDPNVVGRMRIHGEPDPDFPKVKVIVVTDLTEPSHGNACGIGLADVTTRRFLNKVDWETTNMNAVTSGFYEHSMLPIVAATDQQAFEWGIRASHDPHKPKRIVRIKDTLHVSEMYVSEAALEEIKDRTEIIKEAGDLFDPNGSLITF